MKAIWTGQDSDGRELRAYLVTDEKAHEYTGKHLAGPNRVALKTELPAIEFRAPMKWAYDAETLEHAQGLHEARVEWCRRKKKPMPRKLLESGTTWVRVATVSMREAMECRRLGMSMGIANGKRRPGLLSLQQLETLLVACDRRQEAA